MAGWRVGFMSGNRRLIHALSKMKSYIDYGVFTPIQVAAISALEGSRNFIENMCGTYQRRRDILCHGLNSAGWKVTRPKGTLFVWAKIPTKYRHLGSLEFSRFLLRKAGVVVCPGVGFGEYGNEYVRFSLVVDEAQILKAVEKIKTTLKTEHELQRSVEVVYDLPGNYDFV
jgi:alanine-synthesizing transaminase